MSESCIVSVIVPVYNGAATIGTCVQALLAQRYPASAYEVLIVDNRSTDRTRELVARYPVRLLEETEVQSSYAARNRGAAAARGAYLAFTDADCVPDPDWVATLVRALGDVSVGIVAGGIEAWRASALVEQYQAARALRAERAFHHPVRPFAQTANAACPAALFRRVGGFDPACAFGGDLDFSWRLQRETGRRLVYVPAARVWHRHRTTWRGLFALYEKNALANCLLASRWPHYAEYPRWRTGAFLGREMLREGVRTLLQGAGGDGDPATAPLPETVRFAGELWGWLRWHAGARPAVRTQSQRRAGVAA